MNLTLQKEIIKHIFNSFGLLTKNNSKYTLLASLVSDEFLLDKKIVFVSEDRDYQKQCWGLMSEIGNSKIKLLVADITDEIPEFAIILQMDIFPAYVLRLSARGDDVGTIMMNCEQKWVDCGTALQVRCLSGFEGLSDNYLEWKKMKDYKELYELLIGFLKHIED